MFRRNQPFYDKFRPKFLKFQTSAGSDELKVANENLEKSKIELDKMASKCDNQKNEIKRLEMEKKKVVDRKGSIKGGDLWCLTVP